MERLPYELLSNIADVLHHEHFAGLENLSLTCKSIREAVAGRFLESIIIHLSSSEKLSQDVDSLIDIFERYGCFLSVRKLVVRGPPMLDRCKDIGGHPYLQSRERKITGLDLVNTHLERMSDFDIDPPALSPELELETFIPLVELITRLQELKTLVFDCPAQFPHCVLETLQDNNSNCRLYLPQFRLESTTCDPEPWQTARELQLITSPCLHSITVRSSIKRNPQANPSVPRVGINRELIPIHLCPLKHLTILESHPHGGQNLQGAVQLALTQLPMTFRDHPRRTGLESFTIISRYGRAIRAALENLEGMEIKRLHVETPWSHNVSPDPFLPTLNLDALTHLTWLVRLGALTQEICESFLLRAPRLKSLTTSLNQHSECEEWFPRLLRQHVPNLQELEIQKDTCDQRMVDGLSFLNLQRLNIKTFRFCSMPEEVQLYRTFGKFRSLRALTLILDPKLPTAAERSRVESHVTKYYPQALSHPKALETLNWAIDESLALEVWEIIASPTLDSLRILSKGTSGPKENYRLDYIVCRSWHVSRQSRYLSTRPLIEEIDKKTRLQVWDEIFGPRGRNATNKTIKLFRLLWPKRSSTTHWMDDARSIPLAKSL